MGCNCKLRKKLLKRDIVLKDRDIYLDYSSTTKPDLEALYESEQANRILWGNPSSQNSRGALLYKKIVSKSEAILESLNLKSSKIFFDTSSTSIAKKLSISRDKLYFTKETCHLSLDLKNINQLPVDRNDKLLKDDLRKSLKEGDILIYSPVNHEIGSLDDFIEIYNISREKKAYVILDAVQLITKLDINLWKDYCDGFYFSGHKIHSIPGAACLILKNNININLTVSPTLEFSLYDGTFNTPGVFALLKSIEKHFSNFTENIIYIRSLTMDAYRILEGIKTAYTLETPSNSVPGIINISLDEIDSIERLLDYLNHNYIYLSRFSACTGEIETPSEILKKIGRTGNSLNNSLRISFGKDTKRADFYSLVNSINNYLRV